MAQASCSATSRSNTRRVVCRCLRGASRSARRIRSISAFHGSSRDARGGSFFRGSGHADDNARATTRRPTRYFRASSRPDSPPTRESRRIAAYNSTLDIEGKQASPHIEQGDPPTPPAPAE